MKFEMHKFVLFCKSYIGDKQQVRVLIKSYVEHNKDKIPFYISVPRNDLSAFKEIVSGTTIKLIADEDVTSELISEAINSSGVGYINQEIVKLTFWKTEIAENYFCIDSDAYFIRDFYIHDFMYDSDTPYSILVEDKELCTCPLYYSKYWHGREKVLKEIKEWIGLSERRTLTCHGNATFSSKILISFEKDFMIPNGLTYSDILKFHPYEFSWYNFWLQKSLVVPIIQIEPLFKVFHMKEHYLQYVKQGITERDIARAYIGIVLNSGWVRYLSFKSIFKTYDMYPNWILILLYNFRGLLLKVLKKVLNTCWKS